MQKLLRFIALSAFLSLLPSGTLAKSTSDYIALVANDGPRVFHLSESSTSNSYDLAIRFSAKVTPIVRKTNEGYELIFTSRASPKKDPFMGIVNDKLSSKSKLISDIQIERSPGKLKIRIISSSLTEPRITSSIENDRA